MANDLTQRFTHFWQARNTRERQLLIGGGAVLAFGILYGLIYAPLDEARLKLTKRLPEMRAQSRLMTAQVAEIERQRQQAGATPRAEAAPLRTIEASAMANGLREAIKSLTPLGGDRIQVVTLERDTGEWLRWLFDLQRQGIHVQGCRLTVSDKTGLARLDATLAGGAAQ